MKKYKLWVRIRGSQTVFTLIFAQNGLAAKSLGEAQYGVGNVLSFKEVWIELRKYTMRFYEFATRSIKPKPPLTPAQARINALKQSVENSRRQLQAERERQRKQRDTERLRKQLQQR